MAKNGNNKQRYFWIGAAGFLILGAIFLMPKLTGKGKVRAPPGAVPVMGPGMGGALGKPGFADYGVANSLYGNIPSHNFAGMAVEAPSGVLPLGFHLSNVF